MTILDFANEAFAWEDFTIEKSGRRKWLFQDKEIESLFSDNAVISLGHDWCE